MQVRRRNLGFEFRLCVGGGDLLVSDLLKVPENLQGGEDSGEKKKLE